jgi:hypothetical protein
LMLFVMITYSPMKAERDSSIVVFSFDVRAQNLKMNRISDFLRMENYPVLPSRFINTYSIEFANISSEGFAEIGYSFYSESGVSQVYNQERRNSYFRNYSFYGNLGLNLTGSSKLFLAPMLGVSVNYYVLGLDARPIGASSFLDRNISRISRINPDLELAIDARYFFTKRNRNKLNYFLGIRAGYRVVIPHDTWDINGVVPIQQNNFIGGGWFYSFRFGL